MKKSKVARLTAENLRYQNILDDEFVSFDSKSAAKTANPTKKSPKKTSSSSVASSLAPPVASLIPKAPTITKLSSSSLSSSNANAATTSSSISTGAVSTGHSLMDLQRRIRSEPQAYVDDFKIQVQHFQNRLQVLSLNPNSSSSSSSSSSNSEEEFIALVMFLAETAPLYPKLAESQQVPLDLVQLLSERAKDLSPNLRRTITRALMMFRNKDFVQPKLVLPLFFQLFGIKDKLLRENIQNHVINDIKRLNKSSKNVQVNRPLQNFMYSMLSGSSGATASNSNSSGSSATEQNLIAARKSVIVMIKLFRAGIWNDDKTANVIAQACFSRDSKTMVCALQFFLGTFDVDDESAGNDDDDSDLASNAGSSKSGKSGSGKKKYINVGKEINEVYMNFAKGSHITRKRKTAMNKTIKKLKRQAKEQDEFADEDEEKRKRDMQASKVAVSLINDPQGFAEKLFAVLKKNTEKFDVRVMMMDVIARVISAHSLVIINFYPYLQRYLEPHQINIMQLLAITAQAVHDLVPPETIDSVVRSIANHFVTDRSSPQSIAAGLNAIREICARQPLVMTRSLLEDLIQYRKSKDKGVMVAARGLLKMYRDLDPAMLPKREWGREVSLKVQEENKSIEEMRRIKEFGASKARSQISGLDLLEKAEKGDEDGMEENDEDQMEDEDTSTSIYQQDDDSSSWETIEEEVYDPRKERELEEDNEADDQWEDMEDEQEEELNDDEDEEDEDEEEEDMDEEDENNSQDFEEMNQEGEEDESDDDDEIEMDESDDDDQELQEETGDKENGEGTNNSSASIAAQRILTDEDFAKIEKLKAKKRREREKNGKKRKRGDNDDTAVAYGSSDGEVDFGSDDDLIDADDIEGFDKKKRDAKAKKESKFQKYKKEKGGGTSNRQKQKKKGYVMMRKSKRVSNKLRQTTHQKTMRKQLVKKREYNFKKKH